MSLLLNSGWPRDMQQLPRYSMLVNAAARLITDTNVECISLKSRLNYTGSLITFIFLHGLTPLYISALLNPDSPPLTSDKAFSVLAPTLWSNLSTSVSNQPFLKYLLLSSFLKKICFISLLYFMVLNILSANYNCNYNFNSNKFYVFTITTRKIQ